MTANTVFFYTASFWISLCISILKQRVELQFILNDGGYLDSIVGQLMWGL